MGFLTKEMILVAKDLPHEDVDVPEWGGTVRVRCMTGTERDAFEDSIYEAKGEDIKFNRKNFRAKLLARTLVDERGERLFSDAEISALGGKSIKVLDRLMSVAQRLNAISKADQEELTKN
jgi:hypothetical protein